MLETLILVNEKDEQIGTGEKMEVHRKGLLHRCFSIFVFNSDGQMLLQQRARDKYHSGGLWTNTCCSHPRDGEDLDGAVRRRLIEEMGFVCDMKEVLTFIYRADLDRGLVEHEFDHVYVGEYNGEVAPNPEEADGYKWVRSDSILSEVRDNPDRYTVWFKIALEKLSEKFGGLDNLPLPR